jgi:hypothetical protein
MFNIKNDLSEVMKKLRTSENEMYKNLFRYVIDKNVLENSISHYDTVKIYKNDFFDDNDYNTKNNIISKMIEECTVFEKYIVIKSKGVLFIFRIKKTYSLDDFEKVVIKKLEKINSKSTYHIVLNKVDIYISLFDVNEILIFK